MGEERVGAARHSQISLQNRLDQQNRAKATDKARWRPTEKYT